MTQPDHHEDSSRVRTCAGCKQEWVFEEKEEAWLRDKFGESFSEPKRCKPCRQKRREAEDTAGNR